jgi:hypothetical protein
MSGSSVPQRQATPEGKPTPSAGGANTVQQAEQTQEAWAAPNNGGYEPGSPTNGGQGGHVNLYA